MPRRAQTLTDYENQIRFILDTGVSFNQPVSIFLSKKILKLKQTLQEDLTCSICIDTICCEKCFTVLSCGHHYHFVCIQQNPSGKCPLCRS